MVTNGKEGRVTEENTQIKCLSNGFMLRSSRFSTVDYNNTAAASASAVAVAADTVLMILRRRIVYSGNG